MSLINRSRRSTPLDPKIESIASQRNSLSEWKGIKTSTDLIPYLQASDDIDYKYTKAMPNKIEIVVISVAGSESLPKLENDLDRIRIPFRILLATTPQSSDFVSNGDEKLSPIEIATSISHQRARKLAFDLGCEWAIILEDDAEILNGFVNIPNLIAKIDFNFKHVSELAIHLYPEQFGILKSNLNEPYLRILSLPDCAVAYAMNKNALKASLEIQGIESEVADWHPAMRKFSWFAPNASLVRHPDVRDPSVRSLTAGPRNDRINARSVIDKMLSYPMMKIFFLRIILRYSKSYGNNPISKEKLRTRILASHKIGLRGN